MKTSRELFGEPSGVSGAFWSVFGRSYPSNAFRGGLGTSLGLLGLSWGSLGAVSGAIGRSWGGPGAVLGSSWGSLGQCAVCLVPEVTRRERAKRREGKHYDFLLVVERFWRLVSFRAKLRSHLEPPWGGLEASWRHLGSYLEPSWALLYHP